eukprot:scaffold1626_cov176-Chaetoceros_neogracile.AAC.4
MESRTCTLETILRESEKKYIQIQKEQHAIRVREALVVWEPVGTYKCRSRCRVLSGDEFQCTTTVCLLYLIIQSKKFNHAST